MKDRSLKTTRSTRKCNKQAEIVEQMWFAGAKEFSGNMRNNYCKMICSKLYCSFDLLRTSITTLLSLIPTILNPLFTQGEIWDWVDLHKTFACKSESSSRGFRCWEGHDWAGERLRRLIPISNPKRYTMVVVGLQSVHAVRGLVDVGDENTNATICRYTFWIVKIVWFSELHGRDHVLKTTLVFSKSPAKPSEEYGYRVSCTNPVPLWWYHGVLVNFATSCSELTDTYFCPRSCRQGSCGMVIVLVPIAMRQKQSHLKLNLSMIQDWAMVGCAPV